MTTGHATGFTPPRLSRLERRLLDRIQTDFPLVREPYARLAAGLAVVAYLIQGWSGLGTALLLPLGIALAAGAIRAFGRPVS